MFVLGVRELLLLLADSQSRGDLHGCVVPRSRSRAVDPSGTRHVQVAHMSREIMVCSDDSRTRRRGDPPDCRGLRCSLAATG